MENLIRRQPNLIRLCVDQVCGREMEGRLYTLNDPEAVPFADVWDIVRAGEAYFERLGYPQASVQRRRFVPVRGKKTAASLQPCYTMEQLQEKTGQYCTLWLVVNTRRNATWQGMVVREETGARGAFASELELYRVLNMLCSQDGESEEQR